MADQITLALHINSEVARYLAGVIAVGNEPYADEDFAHPEVADLLRRELIAAAESATPVNRFVTSDATSGEAA